MKTPGRAGCPTDRTQSRWRERFARGCNGRPKIIESGLTFRSKTELGWGAAPPEARADSVPSARAAWAPRQRGRVPYAAQPVRAEHLMAAVHRPTAPSAYANEPCGYASAAMASARILSGWSECGSGRARTRPRRDARRGRAEGHAHGAAETSVGRDQINRRLTLFADRLVRSGGVGCRAASLRESTRAMRHRRCGRHGLWFVHVRAICGPGSGSG